MWVIEIETGKKKNIKCAEYIENWVNEKPKYKRIEKKIGVDKINPICYNKLIKEE